MSGIIIDMYSEIQQDGGPGGEDVLSQDSISWAKALTKNGKHHIGNITKPTKLNWQYVKGVPKFDDVYNVSRTFNYFPTGAFGKNQRAARIYNELLKDLFKFVNKGIINITPGYIEAAKGVVSKIFNLAASKSKSHLDYLLSHKKPSRAIKKQIVTQEAEVAFMNDLAASSLQYIEQDLSNLMAKLEKLKKEKEPIQKEVVSTLKRLSIVSSA